MELRREVVIPDTLHDARLFIRLWQEDPDTLVVRPAYGPSDATHQILDASGVPLITHLTERDEVISGGLMYHNSWEFLESLALLATARPGMIFLDVGANIGYFSVLLARTLQSAGRVFAFEPEPDNYLVLEANALLNRALFPRAAPIIPFRLALTEHGGRARLHVYEWNLGLHSLCFAHEGVVGAVEVDTASLDSLCFPATGQVPPIEGRVDLLKADTQGSEFPLVRGGRRLLERDHPLLCLEFEPHLAGEEQCVALVRWLEGCGYGPFRLFHATTANPYQALAEFGHVRTADEVVDQVRRRVVGAYGTLFAFPIGAPPSESRSDSLP